MDLFMGVSTVSLTFRDWRERTLTTTHLERDLLVEIKDEITVSTTLGHVSKELKP